ncbi:hypothetical protein [Pseudomonas orientalis]|uniref:hypothetical protein n=1 Tax=Pseudomonas orientalis TaxID=76758 RepID=UPI002FDF39A7
MSDFTELKRLADAATQGEWQVIETELPCRIGRPHVERRIFTVKDHAQLKASYPVVNGSVALGTDETPVHHMVSMTASDAAFIAAANPCVILALIAENKALRKDAELFRWLVSQCGEEFEVDVTGIKADGEEVRWALGYEGETELRQAVRVAMNEDVVVATPSTDNENVSRHKGR